MAITRLSVDVLFDNVDVGEVMPANFGNIVGDGLFVGTTGSRTEDVGSSVGAAVTGCCVGIVEGTSELAIVGLCDTEGEAEGWPVGEFVIKAAAISAAVR
mmetsp:Transcript_4081/g.6816  ORF Transcript_4081/g.6816 Transcript_4081/m.6816 type:complete len:100 (-) Transcript_4081:244-543(-)